MTAASAIELKVTQVIAGGCHGMIGNRHASSALAGLLFVFKADPPELFIRRTTMNPDILTKIQLHVRNAPGQSHLH